MRDLNPLHLLERQAAHPMHHGPLVDAPGFEPGTSCMSSKCSGQSELRDHVVPPEGFEPINLPGLGRAHGPILRRGRVVPGRDVETLTLWVWTRCSASELPRCGLVSPTGFEPAAFCPPDRRATKLRYGLMMKWGRSPGSNRAPSAYKAGALPDELERRDGVPGGV